MPHHHKQQTKGPVQIQANYDTIGITHLAVLSETHELGYHNPRPHRKAQRVQQLNYRCSNLSVLNLSWDIKIEQTNKAIQSKWVSDFTMHSNCTHQYRYEYGNADT